MNTANKKAEKWSDFDKKTLIYIINEQNGGRLASILSKKAGNNIAMHKAWIEICSDFRAATNRTEIDLQKLRGLWKKLKQEISKAHTDSFKEYQKRVLRWNRECEKTGGGTSSTPPQEFDPNKDNFSLDFFAPTKPISTPWNHVTKQRMVPVSPNAMANDTIQEKDIQHTSHVATEGAPITEELQREFDEFERHDQAAQEMELNFREQQQQRVVTPPPASPVAPPPAAEEAHRNRHHSGEPTRRRRSGGPREEASFASSQYYLEMLEIQRKNAELYQSQMKLKIQLMEKDMELKELQIKIAKKQLKDMEEVNPTPGRHGDEGSPNHE